MILLDDQDPTKAIEEAARLQPSVIWVWRHTHDTSPGEFVTRVEQQLSERRNITRHEFLPYSLPERWLLRWLRGPGQPRYFYQLLELRR